MYSVLNDVLGIAIYQWYTICVLNFVCASKNPSIYWVYYTQHMNIKYLILILFIREEGSEMKTKDQFEEDVWAVFFSFVVFCCF